jgi:dTMP kinase
VLASLTEGLRFMGRTPLARACSSGMLGALAAGGAIIAQGKLFAESVLGGGDAAYGLLFGSMFLGIAAGVALGPRAMGDLSGGGCSGRRSSAPAPRWSSCRWCRTCSSPRWRRCWSAPSPGVAYVVGITLLGLEIEDELRGRMFGLVQSLMRIDLLLVTATTPFIAGVIGTREGPARHQHQRRLGDAARRAACSPSRSAS